MLQANLTYASYRISSILPSANIAYLEYVSYQHYEVQYNFSVQWIPQPGANWTVTAEGLLEFEILLLFVLL